MNTGMESALRAYGQTGLEAVNLIKSQIEKKEQIACTITYNNDTRQFSLQAQDTNIRLDSGKIKAIFDEIKTTKASQWKPTLLSNQTQSGPLLFTLK